MIDAKRISQVEKIIGYKFKDKKLLQTALTHSSYSNEHKVESNERLEFLGDAVIEYIVTEILYREFSGGEGELSKIRALVVSEKPLAEAVTKFGLDEFLIKGVGESRNTTESKAIKCDLFEAICGAIYLDGGIGETRKFFSLAVGDIIDSIKINGFTEDAKTRLQELMKSAKIVYSTSKSGEDHQPVYKTTVYINDVKSGIGTGGNKRTSEENAASDALKSLKQV